MSLRLFPIFWFILLILAACTPAKKPEPTLPQAEGSANPPVLPNLLLQVTGKIEVRRAGSALFVPVALGAQVQPGDTLRLVEGEAAIFCGNEALWDASPQSLPVDYDAGVPCQNGRPPRPALDLVRLRSNNLYVLSPRSGFVMDERPTLRWHPVDNVQMYTLRLISDDEKERPPVTVAGNELPYPAEWEPLQAEVSYRLQIEMEVDGLKFDSGQEGEFLLLSPEKKEQLDAQVERLRQRSLHDLSLTLLLAELHLNYNLYSEDIELLRKADHNQVAVQHLLGETYLQMGLPDEATAAYSQALALAQEAELPEEQAAAHLRLSLLFCSQANEQKADTHKQEALRLYEQMERQKNKVDALLEEVDGACQN